MPHTAPVPNIVPIPGMDPGEAVAAGGAGSGGDDGNAGDGGDKENAGGGGGGDDADGGNKNSPGCGNGSVSGCKRHNPKPTAGDPIDPVTGEVFTEACRDFELAGNLPVASCTSLHLDRIYKSTSRRRDTGFGHGWVHTFSQELEVGRISIVVWKSSGGFLLFPALKEGERAIGESGYLLERSGDVYILDCGDYRKRRFEQMGPDPARYRLTSITDWNGNRCTLAYDKGLLGKILDAVGRTVEFVPDGKGHIARIQCQSHLTGEIVVFSEYEYDAAGNLVAYTDADGNRTRFTYDEAHYLTSHTSPTGLRFQFVYDNQGRCRETWGAYEDGRPEPALAESAPRYLADGTTKAKGIYHVKVDYSAGGFSEVIDSTEVSRLYGDRKGVRKATTGRGIVTRTFDDLGFETSVTNEANATWKTERDERGRQVRVTDPTGSVHTTIRNAAGRPVRIIDEAGNVTTYEYDARGNKTREVDPFGGATTFDYDERGLLVRRTSPGGATREYFYDAYANLVAVRRANGALWRYEYDGFGSLVAEINPYGGRVEYTRSRRGDILTKKDEHGQVWTYEFDFRGNPRRVIEPGGAVYEMAQSGVGWVGETKRPDGQTVRFRFDRDGQTTEVRNGNGEVHTLEYGRDRHVFRETTFDGRVFEYSRDTRGLITRLTTNFGEYQAAKYDDRGVCVEVADQDGRTTSYSYDTHSLLVGAVTEVSEVRFARRPDGDIASDAQVLAGQEVAVEHTYDANRNIVKTTSTRGYGLDLHRDAMGERDVVTMGGERCIEIDRDVAGLEARRRLRGCAITLQRDLAGRPVRQTVDAGAGRGPASGQPELVGQAWLAPGETVYRWSPTGELAGIDTREGTTELVYDASHRLVSYAPWWGTKEIFSYDLDNNAYPQGTPTQYGPGGRLLRRGSTEYVWSDAGRLVEKRSDEGTWHYEWSSDGLLASVKRPDGTLVAFQYDAFARRLEKCVTDPTTGVTERTRYVWNTDWVIQDITTRTKDGATVPVRRRDYVYDGSMKPWAHVEILFDAVGAESSRTTLHYVNDPFGFPERLVDDAGREVAVLRRSAFGAVDYAPGSRATTPLRKIGQYYDEETGLAYNRWRYYDPEAGRFISDDPMGLRGSLNSYSPCLNPFRWDDPDGLSSDQSNRTADLRANIPNKGACYAVGLLSDGSTMITMNRNGYTPAPALRDGTDWPNQRVPGENNAGAITQQEFQNTKGVGTGEDGCNHAEQRMIRAAEDKGLLINQISATNNCCDACHKALLEHNDAIKISDPNGNQVHP